MATASLTRFDVTLSPECFQIEAVPTRPDDIVTIA
jgi:hypothetical protein